MTERSVRIPVEEFAKSLNMRVLERGKGEIDFTTVEIGRPGLQLTGYYNHFLASRVQLIGNSEMFYLYAMERAELSERLDAFMAHAIPCIVIARNNTPPKELLSSAAAHAVPVFISGEHTDDIGHRITNYLGRRLAPSALIHGELLDVFGVGLLLRGPSGLGKSETALEMVKEGHRLVADDVVEITRVTEGRLVGRAPEATQCLMEDRGIGIVDIRYLYGVGAVVREKTIDMVIDLELWNAETDYGGHGAPERTATLLGVDIPATLLPVSPGRNLAVVIEVAARNFLLRKTGYDTGGALARRAMEKLEGE